MTIVLRAGVAVLALALAGCSGRIVPPAATPGAPSARPVAPSRPPVPQADIRPSGGRIVAATPMSPAPVVPGPVGTTAATSGVLPGPAIALLSFTDIEARAALAAFARSCPALSRRPDASGLTRGADWQPVCDAARAQPGDARAFFARWFETAQVGEGKAFATGYYEPEIAGSMTPGPGYAPVYARPGDLIDVDLGAFSADLKTKAIRGKVSGGKLVPYDDRTQIEEGSLNGRAAILGYAKDPIALFFLQIQGSGRLRMDDGSILRIGYATQNGRDYTGIGSVMRQRGLLGPGQASMQGIVGWLHANPAEGRALMRENRSYVFFRVLDGAPLGALGYAVDGQVSAAADPKFVPLGAPVFLSMDRADVGGLWVVSDTGGAIKGANRFDTFWGAGPAAALTAGGMSARGTAFLLLPIGTVARVQAERAATPTGPGAPFAIR